MEEKLIKLMLEQFSEGEYETIDEAISDLKETVKHIGEDDIIEYIIDNDEEVEVNGYLKLKVLEYKAERSLHLDDFKEIIENNEEIKNEIKKSFELIQKKYDENINSDVSEEKPLFTIYDEFDNVIELLEKASNTDFNDFTEDEDIFWQMGSDTEYNCCYNKEQVVFSILLDTIDLNIPILHKMSLVYFDVAVYKDDVW